MSGRSWNCILWQHISRAGTLPYVGAWFQRLVYKGQYRLQNQRRLQCGWLIHERFGCTLLRSTYMVIVLAFLISMFKPTNDEICRLSWGDCFISGAYNTLQDHLQIAATILWWRIQSWWWCTWICVVPRGFACEIGTIFFFLNMFCIWVFMLTIRWST